MDLLDDNSRNFLNDILTNQDRCSNLECPDNYIQEITSLGRCNDSPCNLEDDLNNCCMKICENSDDCSTDESCNDYRDVKICTKNCTNNSDCSNNLNCITRDNNSFCLLENEFNTNIFYRLYYKIERILLSDNILIDTIVLITVAYLISKLINIFNININIP